MDSLGRDSAAAILVDSSLREKILPGRKAFAYKLREDALHFSPSREEAQRVEKPASYGAAEACPGDRRGFFLFHAVSFFVSDSLYFRKGVSLLTSSVQSYSHLNVLTATVPQMTVMAVSVTTGRTIFS